VINKFKIRNWLTYANGVLVLMMLAMVLFKWDIPGIIYWTVLILFGVCLVIDIVLFLTDNFKK